MLVGKKDKLQRVGLYPEARYIKGSNPESWEGKWSLNYVFVGQLRRLEALSLCDKEMDSSS